MEVKCNYKVYYEQETHDRVSKVLGRLTNVDMEVQMVTALNQIIQGMGIFAMAFNIPKIVFEITPIDNVYPVYNVLHRETKINANIQNIVVPNKSNISVSIIEPEIKLPEIPVIEPSIKENEND